MRLEKNCNFFLLDANVLVQDSMEGTVKKVKNIFKT